MKKAERIDKFKSFYLETYKRTLHRFLKKTGDFLNAEMLMERVYSNLYPRFMKMKTFDPENAEALLRKSFGSVLNGYMKKQKKPAFETDVFYEEDYWERIYLLDEAAAEKRSLRQEILSFVSQKPIIARRLFAYIVYFEKSMEEAAEKLDLLPEDAAICFNGLIAEIEEQFLQDYMQEVEE